VDTNDITEDSGLVNETLQWTQVGAITVQSTSITSVISSLLIFLLCLSQNFEIHTANQFIRINQQNAQCSSLGIYIALSVPTCFNPQGIILRELFKFPSNYFFIISVRIQKTLVWITPTLKTWKCNNFQKGPFILESKFLITFLLASKIHLMTN